MITDDPDLQAFAAAVDDFCRRTAGTRAQRDRLTDHGSRPHDAGVYARCAELGWLGVGLPEDVGGSGGGRRAVCTFAERTSYGLLPVTGYTTTAIAAGPYRDFGSPAQRDRVLGGMVHGAVEAVAMSEPDAGSDVAAISCRARPAPGGWVVDGQKTWCSNAHLAAHVLLVARTSTGPDRHHGLTMFCVPTDVAGLRIAPIDTLGGREVNDLWFTDCRLPADSVVGAVDGAWPQLMAGLETERLVLAATVLGRARRAFDDTLAHVTQRTQFGRPVGSFQAVRHRLADLATELECCDLLVGHVAALADAQPGRRLAREASMAKLKVTEVAKRVALEGMQLTGGSGYTTAYDMEAHLHATVVSTVYGGTSEIQREVIGRTLGL